MTLIFWTWFLSFSVIYLIMLFQDNFNEDVRKELGLDREIVIPMPHVKVFIFAPFILVAYLFLRFVLGEDVTIH